MAVPEGYVALDLVGFTDKGTYSGAAVYMKNDLVHKDNVIWRCIADNTQGVPPAAGENWEKWIEGSAQMSGCTAVDTEGMIGAKNSVVVAQALIDAIADKVMNDLVAKTQIVNNLLATVTGNVLDATQGKVLDDKITQLNGNLTVLNAELKDLFKISESEVDFSLESGGHISQDVTISAISGYKYLFSYPQAIDPIGNTAHIEITVYRRTDNVFSVIIHNSFINTLTGKVKIINLFALQK